MIRLWHKLRAASPVERALAAEALVLLLAARLALWCLPFASVRHLMSVYTRFTRGGSVPAERAAWAVAAASRRLPAPFRDCLPQALAAEAMLRRHGAPAELKIGVRRGTAGRQVEAHAWVVSGDRVVVGALEDLPTYLPLGSAP